jgi:hypothetical protein
MKFLERKFLSVRSLNDPTGTLIIGLPPFSDVSPAIDDIGCINPNEVLFATALAVLITGKLFSLTYESIVATISLIHYFLPS